MKTVYIEDIADALEMTMTEWTQFLNTETGEIVSLPSGNYLDWSKDDEKLAEEIEDSDVYVRLPSQYDLHEYNIMENFSDACPDDRKARRLFSALSGRKPFRNFKDTINCLGIEEDYYAFRFRAFCDIAIEWCEENSIPYARKQEEKRGL